jgi:hypothetical protein
LERKGDRCLPARLPAPSMPDTWDGTAADAMLEAHEYRQLDALLRSWIDGARSHEAVDWVDRRAEEGHVTLIYHAARNLAKGGSGGRVMNGAEFRRAFRLALMLLVRAAQDVLSVAVVQGQSPRAAVFAMLRDKVFGWLGEQFPMSRWPPLAELLADVQARVDASCPLPLPTWVLSTGPGFAAAYLHLGAHLGFENPSDKAVAACDKTRVPLDEERRRVAQAFFSMLGGMSWEGVVGIGVSAFLARGGSPSSSPKPALLCSPGSLAELSAAGAAAAVPPPPASLPPAAMRSPGGSGGPDGTPAGNRHDLSPKGRAAIVSEAGPEGSPHASEGSLRGPEGSLRGPEATSPPASRKAHKGQHAAASAAGHGVR